MGEVTNPSTSSSSLELVTSLCREFHSLGWMTGTGGAISVRDGATFLVTPSGLLKERLVEGDLVRVDGQGERVGEGGGRLSSCWPNFSHIYNLRCFS